MILQMVYRRQRRDSTTKMHPTYEKILHKAVEVLFEQGFDRFSVQDVLDRAEVSRGTLYHHYGDVDSLIEATLVEAYGTESIANRLAFHALVERATSVSEFRQETARLMIRVAEVGARVRIRRAHTLSLCSTRPLLGEAVAAEQQELTDAWVDTILLAKERGFVRPEIDPRLAAVFVQAIGIGRIVDDLASEPLSKEQWAKLFFDVYDAVLFTPEP